VNGLDFTRRWLDRALLSLGGAFVGGGFIALLEAVRASRQWRAPVRALLFGDGAVLVPLATAIGFAVAALGALLDPDHRRSVGEVLRGMRALDDSGRARWAAAALIVPTAVLAWMLACAHEARSALEREAPTMVIGTWMAVASLGALVLTAAAVIAALPIAARTLTARLDPLIAGAWGASFAVVLVLLGLRLGDASGNGATPFAILGVLTREALGIYVERLTPHGVIALHVSNRHMELASVVAAFGKAEGLATYDRQDDQAGDFTKDYRANAEVVVLARNTADLGDLPSWRGWRKLDPTPGVAEWTDDYSDILRAILRKRL